MLKTKLLTSGARSLSAYYRGDTIHQPGASNLVVHRVGSLGQNGFAPSMNYPIAFPGGVRSGDFNGDGKTDLAMVSFEGHSANVSLGSGNGRFVKVGDYPTDLNPRALTVADFNEDGNADLAVANLSSRIPPFNVSVLLGNGDGSLRKAVSYPIGTDRPCLIESGDFNGDGKADLALANCASAQLQREASSVSILLGNGDGSFRSAVHASAGASPPSSMVLEDFNRDRKTDIAIANAVGISVLFGNGDGTLRAPVGYTAGSPPPFAPGCLGVADFNGDGVVDLAVTKPAPLVPNARPGDGAVLVLLGNSDGTFRPPVSNSVGPSVSANNLALGDFNGDGRPDLSLSVPNAVHILLGNGDGTFRTEEKYSGARIPYGTAVGDFNGDGRTDLAVENLNDHHVSILLGIPAFTSRNSASYAADILAPEMIVVGEAPAIAPELSVSADNPWPTTLSGVRLAISDSAGERRAAPVYFVAPSAIGFLIPTGTAVGQATAELTTATGARVLGTLDVGRVAPGLYAANSNGIGAAAGFWVRVDAEGAQSQGYLFDPSKPEGSREPIALDLGPPTEQVYLSLYGTGFRLANSVSATVGGVSVPVYGFARAEAYQGLDVVNIGTLPRALIGRGIVEVRITFDGRAANAVTVNFR